MRPFGPARLCESNGCVYPVCVAHHWRTFLSHVPIRSTSAHCRRCSWSCSRRCIAVRAFCTFFRHALVVAGDERGARRSTPGEEAASAQEPARAAASGGGACGVSSRIGLSYY